MTALIIGTAILGAALGRRFKVLILAPLSVAVALVIFFEPRFWPHSALPKALEFLVLTSSLQFGFTLPMWPRCLRAFFRRQPNARRGVQFAPKVVSSRM